MRLVAYRGRSGRSRWGVLVDGGMLTARRLQREAGLDRPLRRLSLGGMIAERPGWQEAVQAAVDRALAAGAVPQALRPAAPAVDRPGKVVCVGLNYREHAAEGGREAPDRPLLFSKFANAVVADGEPIVRPEGTRALDLEAELGVVVGGRARRVSPEQAEGLVAGYVVVNDVSARDWQGNKAALREGERGDGQWLRAKGSDTFLPMSAVLATADEVRPEEGVHVRSWRLAADGTEHAMQNGSTADMIWSVPDLIAWISRAVTLEPGDVIATGTPSGVGVFRDPPMFLEPGDIARCEIDGIGAIENRIVDWTEDPRDG